MAHLGEGVQISTVNTEKIILADAKGETFTMEVNDLGNIINSDVIHKVHNNNGIDCNDIRTTIIISGYRWTNSPSNSIAILEVISYSNDWILQRFTEIGNVPVRWERCYYDGDTWGTWIKSSQ